MSMLVAARLPVGVVMTAAGVGKLRESAVADAKAIIGYKIVSDDVATGLACVLPGIELGLGLSLLTGLNSRFAAAGSGAMLAGYTAALVHALRKGIVTDCGCFGSLAASQVSWKLVARNAVLIAAATAVAVNEPDRATLDRYLSPAVRNSLSVVLLGGVAVGSLLDRLHSLGVLKSKEVGREDHGY